MTENLLPRYELERAVRAWDEISAVKCTQRQALEQLKVYDEYDRWLSAERAHHRKIRDWLHAEAAWRREQIKFDDPTYAAARKGFNMVKRYIPTLDGVASFDGLSPALQFRYAAFAAAVLNMLPPPEVKSAKQRAAEVSNPLSPEDRAELFWGEDW